MRVYHILKTIYLDQTQVLERKINKMTIKMEAVGNQY